MALFEHEHDELRRSVRRFVDTEINPYVNEWEAAEQWPSHTVCKKAGAAGFLGITKPKEYGGSGLDYSFSTVWAEELGRINAGGVAMALGAVTDMATPALAKHGSHDLKQEFLAPTVAGDLVACIGVSEVRAGSDVASIKTTARRDGREYVINGGKMWITNGIQGDWVCLLCNTSEANGPHRNKSLILVPLDTKGVQRAKKLRKLGQWSSDTAQLFFDEVRVPQRFLIGEEGQGFIYQMEQFVEERLFAASRTYTQMQGIVDATIEYTRQREAFGHPLLSHEWIQYTLADLQTEILCLRSLTHAAVADYVAGKDIRMLTAMAKLKAAKLARSVPDACLQFWGGAGYLWESHVARMFRDTRLVAIGGGASEVMMGIIAKEMGLGQISR